MAVKVEVYRYTVTGNQTSVMAAVWFEEDNLNHVAVIQSREFLERYLEQFHDSLSLEEARNISDMCEQVALPTSAGTSDIYWDKPKDKRATQMLSMVRRLAAKAKRKKQQ